MERVGAGGIRTLCMGIAAAGMVLSVVGVFALTPALAVPETGDSAVDEAIARAAGDQAEFIRSGGEWSADVDCAMCHAVEVLSFADESLLGQKHGSMGCLECHADTDGLAKVHKKVKAKTKAPKRLKKTTVDQETCLTCHGTNEDLVRATAHSTVLTDKNGTEVNPHEAAGLTAAHQDAGMNCGSCHSMHAERDVQTYCGTCHHMEVYECGTCHG